MHSNCINMPYATYGMFSITDHYQFFCRQCVGLAAGSGVINYAAMMSRIAARAPDVTAMREQAESEQQLLVFYGAMLPDVCPPINESVSVDQPSVQLLNDHCAWLLKQYSPASVAGDGNCLYRAVSLSLFGRESAYYQLRLLTAIEVLMHRDFYDVTSTQYYEPYRTDLGLVLPGYTAFVADLVRDCTYSDMLSVLALSSVIQKPIQTRWPIAVHPGEASPFTKLVCGRDVHTVNPVQVLWTVCGQYAPHSTVVSINHFVPLIALPVAIVTLTKGRNRRQTQT